MTTIDPNLVAELKRLERQVFEHKEYLDRKEQEIAAAESRLRQGLVKNSSAQNFQNNVAMNRGNLLVPGNIGDINKVTWGFVFSTPIVQVAPGTNVRTQISVTQEAGFIWKALTKTVYDLDTLTNEITYIDPDEPMIGEAKGLSFFLRDAQSSREFYNIPQTIDQIGNPRWPTILETPSFMLPNSITEVSFINDSPTNTYLASIQFWGVRIRGENLKNLLSTVYG